MSSCSDERLVDRTDINDSGFPRNKEKGRLRFENLVGSKFRSKPIERFIRRFGSNNGVENGVFHSHKLAVKHFEHKDMGMIEMSFENGVVYIDPSAIEYVEARDGSAPGKEVVYVGMRSGTKLGPLRGDSRKLVEAFKKEVE